MDQIRKRKRKKSKKTEVVNVRTDDYDVFIGRPSKWGNHYVIGRDGDRETVIKKYRIWILSRPDLLAALVELDGRRIGCFCKPKACHGDVLVALIEKGCRR